MHVPVRCPEYVLAIASGIGLLEGQTPQTYAEAKASPQWPAWKAAMQKEWDACVAQGTWELVRRSDLPATANVIRVKWVYKIKTDERGENPVFKGRITPKGFMQRHMVDYFQTFAHTGKYKTLRIVLSIAANDDLELNQLDVPTAFVRADLDEEVYMEMPAGFEQPGMVCKLLKSLYGLKQSPRNWYLLCSGFIVNVMGYTACASDPCLFLKRSRSGRLIYLFLFVDDMQVAFYRQDAEEWAEDKAKLRKRFDVKDLGESKWMLGMHITRDRSKRTIKLDQELYVSKALERFGLTQCKSSHTPASQSSGKVEDDRDGGGDEAPLRLYQEKVGTLLYSSISTRPDVSYAVNQLTRHMQAPRRRHMVAADRVLRYLAGTPSAGLVFGGRGSTSDRDIVISAYSDSDWGSDPSDRKSVTGWIAKLNGDVISWSSKKQSLVALSSCEAELYAASSAVQELLWLRGLMKELGRLGPDASVLSVDNQSAIGVAENGVRSERTKHIDIRYRHLTDTIERGKVSIEWIPTAEQQADILTKALPLPQFVKLRSQLMQL